MYKLHERFMFFKEQKFLLIIALLLCSIYLPIFVSSILLFLWLIYFVFISKKNNFLFRYSLLALAVFFALMLLSFFWSINPNLTIKTLPKEFPFLLAFALFSFFTVSKNDVLKVLKTFSYFTVFVAAFFILRGIIRSFLYNKISYMFFHGEYFNDYGLVPKSLNAVHISVFCSLAFIYFLQNSNKSHFKYFSLVIFGVFLWLLSSTVIIVSTIILTIVYFLYFSKTSNKLRLRNIILLIGIILLFFSYNKLIRYISYEVKHNTNKGIGHNVIKENNILNNKITWYDAWNKPVFTPQDYFPGTAFRIYQARVFKELVAENNTFWLGFGFNASQKKIEEKSKALNVFLGNEYHEGYQKKNFHNQYIQTFAELGFIGFLLLITILFINTRNAFLSKDFLHISFAILMISLFLTESFLWRQRGVIFFTILYSLFNVSLPKKHQQ